MMDMPLHDTPGYSVLQHIGIWNQLDGYTHQLEELLMVFLSSFQVICSLDLIQEIFLNYLNCGALQLPCIDKAHFFLVQFGLYFRDYFFNS
jgi:hypothetical protein